MSCQDTCVASCSTDRPHFLPGPLAETSLVPSAHQICYLQGTLLLCLWLFCSIFHVSTLKEKELCCQADLGLHHRMAVYLLCHLCRVTRSLWSIAFFVSEKVKNTYFTGLMWELNGKYWQRPSTGKYRVKLVIVPLLPSHFQAISWDQSLWPDFSVASMVLSTKSAPHEYFMLERTYLFEEIGKANRDSLPFNDIILSLLELWLWLIPFDNSNTKAV